MRETDRLHCRNRKGIGHQGANADGADAGRGRAGHLRGHRG
jgi:hypothetical protein